MSNPNPEPLTRINPHAMQKLKTATFNSQVLSEVCQQLHHIFSLTGGTPSLNLDYDDPSCLPGDMVPTLTIGLRFATCSMNSTAEIVSE